VAAWMWQTYYKYVAMFIYEARKHVLYATVCWEVHRSTLCGYYKFIRTGED